MTEVFRDVSRLLTFRLGADRFDAFTTRHLAVGFTFTWLAGIGRYWDSPRAHLLQRFGAGSLAYVVCLAALLWLVIKPVTLNPRFGFRGLLTFVCLTSPPALLYAIPVERLYPTDVAGELNVWFLAIVAFLRVALLVFFLRRGTALEWFAAFVATLLPVSAIIVALAALNLEHAVFNIMAGLHEAEHTPADQAYALVFSLSLLAIPTFIVSLLSWIGLSISASTTRRKMRLAALIAESSKS